MNIGTIVCHRQHPEWGFGVVRQRDEDPFGDLRFQVAFDHENQLQPCAAEELHACTPDAEAMATGQLGPVEVFTRKLLAGIILSENARTGAFLRSTLKPLPHQVHFLDRVLSGYRLGHLAADDVGLGKTIEAGLLISHFYRDAHPRKILILCPAGLALQWQDEMLDHFGLRFSIANRDFKVNSEAGWENRHLVIGSIDTLKREGTFAFIHSAGPFDLVVVDEAHRLTAKREFLSGDLRTTESYRLVKRLVDENAVIFQKKADGSSRSPRLLFLSATPHQGDNLRFALLLGLIRPDLFPGNDEHIVANLTEENLRECLTKTPKSRAIDWDGKPIFKGHVVQTLTVKRSVTEHAVARALSHYIHRSISARLGRSRATALVIELVMHTFHKLASSSWQALLGALSSRLNALHGQAISAAAPLSGWDDDESTADLNELQTGDTFYEDEIKDLRELVDSLHSLQTDTKWDLFKKTVLEIDAAEPGAKILIFTQYYATQELLREGLGRLFPRTRSVIINGSMGMDARTEARIAFETDARFLISTEAGGEGVNFQKACHVMINYDLPWNPMRLQQRIGRLDRYLQKHLVQVFNLTVDGSWDNQITLRILNRLESIQETLGQASGTLEDYREMIIGEVGEQLDARKAFVDAVEKGIHISDEEIERKLRDAAKAVERTKALGMRGTAFKGLENLPTPVLTADDFKEAFAACLGKHQITLRGARTSDRQWVQNVFQFLPPKDFREPKMRPSATRYVVFDKDRYAAVRGTFLGRARGQNILPELAGFGDALTDWLFESAFTASLGDRVFRLGLPDDLGLGSGWLRIAALRWRGNLRDLNAPDGVLLIWVNDSGEIREIPFNEAADIARHAVPWSERDTPEPTIAFPDDQGTDRVQARLRELVTLDPEARRLAGWSWLACARIDPIATTDRQDSSGKRARQTLCGLLESAKAANAVNRDKWDELLQLAQSDCIGTLPTETLQWLIAQDLPPVCGYELRSTAGTVTGTAEWAWPDKMVAILVDDHPETPFLSTGWRVLAETAFIQNPRSLQSLLTA